MFSAGDASDVSPLMNAVVQPGDFMISTPHIVSLLWLLVSLWSCDSPPAAPQVEPPIANAGQDLRSEVSDTVVLDGTDSRPADNSTLNYSWAQVEGPLVSIQNAGSGRAQVAPIQEGIYVFRLTVTDGRGLSASDEMVLQVSDPTGGKRPDNVAINSAPVARAGRDLEVEVEESVLLDGSASSDAEAGELAFSWVQLDGPPLVIQGAARPQATVVPTEVGEYAFRLTVTDEGGLSASDEMRLIVRRTHTEGVLRIRVTSLSDRIERIEYTIAAADLDTLRGELVLTANQTAEKTLLSMPPGRDRLIELFAYDVAQQLVAFGSELVQIGENETVDVLIEMSPLRTRRGSIEVEAVFEDAEGGG